MGSFIPCRLTVYNASNRLYQAISQSSQSFSQSVKISLFAQHKRKRKKERNTCIKKLINCIDANLGILVLYVLYADYKKMRHHQSSSSSFSSLLEQFVFGGPRSYCLCACFFCIWTDTLLPKLNWYTFARVIIIIIDYLTCLHESVTAYFQYYMHRCTFSKYFTDRRINANFDWYSRVKAEWCTLIGGSGKDVSCWVTV